MTKESRPSAVGSIMGGLNAVGSALIFLMTLLICADIVGRSLFDVPVAGVAEMISLLIVAVVFLQLGQAIRSDSLARTTVMLDVIGRRAPRLVAFLQGTYALVAVLVFAVLAYGIWHKVQDALSSDEHVGVYGLFVAPVWPLYVVVFIGSCAAVLQFGLQMWGHWQGMFGDAKRSALNS